MAPETEPAESGRGVLAPLPAREPASEPAPDLTLRSAAPGGGAEAKHASGRCGRGTSARKCAGRSSQSTGVIRHPTGRPAAAAEEPSASWDSAVTPPAAPGSGLAAPLAVAESERAPSAGLELGDGTLLAPLRARSGLGEEGDASRVRRAGVVPRAAADEDDDDEVPGRSAPAKSVASGVMLALAALSWEL